MSGRDASNPYQPPSPSESERTVAGALPASGLRSVLILIFVLQGLVSFSQALYYATIGLNQDPGFWAEGGWGWTIASALELAWGWTWPLYGLSIAIFCWWLYQAASATRTLGAEGTEFTPGWTVGWFFVPIANVFMPYRAVKELYQASAPADDPERWKASRVPLVLTLWWSCWIGSLVLSRLFVFAGNDSPLTFWSSVLALLVRGVAALAVVAVVQGIQYRLETKARLRTRVIESAPSTLEPQPG